MEQDRTGTMLLGVGMFCHAFLASCRWPIEKGNPKRHPERKANLRVSAVV
jgi:hypothetical protein